jgi:hypothetical protein
MARRSPCRSASRSTSGFIEQRQQAAGDPMRFAGFITQFHKEHLTQPWQFRLHNYVPA